MIIAAVEEKQHEAGVDAMAKNTPAPIASDKNDNVQVTVSVSSDERSPTEQPQAPKPEENVPNEVELKTREDESNTGSIPPSDAPTPLNTIESPPPPDDKFQSLAELPLSSSSPANLIKITKPDTNSEDSSPATTDAAEHEHIVDFTAQHRSESLPAKPSGFFESLTANFAPDTKTMWAQIFGPRYEDSDQDENLQEDNKSNLTSSTNSVSSKSWLQAKLARERKLDEQIQASQRRYRDRMLRNAAANNTARKPSRVQNSRRSQSHIVTISPLERAGLSLTQIRVCFEKALDDTCKCFHHLHAEALEEEEDPITSSSRGIYITQGELEHVLRELFDLADLDSSSTKIRKGSLVAPLNFVSNNTAASVEEISMNTVLQASWFVPFGQLPQLRSLVMKMTKRHLSEDKLAILNRNLHKHFTLWPLSTKLQNLVLQLSNYQLKDPLKAPIWPEGKKSSDELAQELLGCIAVGKATMTTDSEDYTKFLLFLPVELVAKTHLSSVVCAQRLVFFRFFIEIVAAERMRLHSKSPESLATALPGQTQTRRKTRKKPSKRMTLDVTIKDCAIPADSEEIVSLRAAHGSLPSTSEAHDAQDAPAYSDIFQLREQLGDEGEKPASQLQQQLEAAIARQRQSLPTIDDQNTTLNPAVRATYLAAVACHESVLVMLENNIDADAAMSDKLTHFIELLQDVQSQTSDTTTNSSPLKNDNEDHQLQQSPPPYPESTVPEEEDRKSESSTVQPHFPPPYAITTPSYWTFAPSIPEAKSSIAKLTSKSPSTKSSHFRSHFMPTQSPGVGAYNIQQGEKLTFQQKPSYSFGPMGGGDCSGEAPDALLPKGKTHQRMKTSLAFVSPMIHPPEDNELAFSSTRVHFGFQSDRSHLDNNDDGFPPDYNENEPNEAPDERNLSVETEMDRALRLQQRIFMDEFVQQVGSNQQESTSFVPRDKHNNDHTKPSSSSKSKPYWSTSEVSPGIERLLHRQRRAPSAVPSAPRTARTAKRIVKKPLPSPPPRRQLDNDQHLAWAARISELYQPTASVPEV